MQKILAFILAMLATGASLFGSCGQQDKKRYVVTDLSYGTEASQKLDLYIPTSAAGSSCGLVLFIHGGAWISGDKSECTKKILESVNDSGYASATMNYRFISDSVNLLDLMDDVDNALKAIQKQGKEYNVTIDRVLMIGTSAGSHLALLYGYSRHQTAPMKVCSILSYCGPTDLADPNFYLETSTLGSPAEICDLMSKACGTTFTQDTFDAAVPALQKVSPLSYVCASCPPTIIAHGAQDTVVPYSNATSLDAALTAKGVKHDFVTYPNSGHNLDKDTDAANEVSALLDTYATTYLK